MAVTKADYNRYHTLLGTLPEIAGALRDEAIPPHDVLSVVWNGSAYVVIYYK